jgi:hypothetical protein
MKNNPIYKYLMVLIIVASAGLQGWMALITNFAKEVVGVDGFQMGMTQSFREIPGFLTFLVVYLLMVFKEHRLSAWSIVLMGIGIGITGFFTTLTGLLFTTMVMSIGFHYFETTSKSLIAQHFSKQDAPVVFARLRGFGALANIVVGASVWGLAYVLSYKVIFILVGIITVCAGVYLLYMNPAINQVMHQNKKLFLKKKYSLFYVLNFLSGARRQIFIVFAIFLLVERFELSVTTVAGIFVLNYFMTYLTNGWISRSIKNYGEKVVLTMEAASLVVIFLGYAFIPMLNYDWIVFVVVGLYVIDNIFFNFAIGLNTYLQKIADTQDLGSQTAVGFTINHISAVVIPLFGGAMWMLNWQLPFIIGACLSAISIVFTMQIAIKHHENT